MDTLSSKEKNAIRVRRFRERQKEIMGKDEFNKKEAEARKQRRILQRERENAIKEKEKKTQQKQTLAKQTALTQGNNMVSDIFASILNSIPKEKPKAKTGRKIVYIRKEEMTKKEERAVASREKKREYMREYMRKYNEEKRKNKN